MAGLSQRINWHEVVKLKENLERIMSNQRNFDYDGIPQDAIKLLNSNTSRLNALFVQLESIVNKTLASRIPQSFGPRIQIARWKR